MCKNVTDIITFRHIYVHDIRSQKYLNVVKYYKQIFLPCIRRDILDPHLVFPSLDRNPSP